MTSSPDIKKILKQHKLAPSKKRGQNFLVNPQTSEAIVRKAGVTPDDIILELGVGLGSLTFPLASAARRVIGIELDRGIVEWYEHEKTLPENVELVHQDLLKADFDKISSDIGCRLKILANLPYNVSNPLLFKLIENREVVESATLMLQKEVGQRLAAGPGGKDYGVLSVLAATCAETAVLMQIGPGQFHPRPKVDSVVVKIVFHPESERIKSLPPFSYPLLKKVVKASFQQRRKTLHNSLRASGIVGTEKENLPRVFEASRIAPSARPETLTVTDFINLANAIGEAPIPAKP
ncbi:MAG: ribosomal RNA small subunit methyltransferase A [Proteobacteria bacterium]|nr:ribosomal RNA small subunit methyltransferase A [Pseudomonadota bacterium]MBU1738737.1 ribosomal RNA small subunit methyltransferase A [Pseudomonadota bacterium]